MDLGEKDKFRLEKRGDNHLDFHPSSMPSDWRLTADPRMVLVSSNTSSIGDQIGSSQCPSVSMVDTFCPSLWDHPNNSQNLGFCEPSIQPSANVAKPVQGSSRLDMGWNPSDSISKGGIYLQTTGGAGVLPPGLSQFPADSAFIERAARFSCFNGSSFGGTVSPFSSSPYSGTSRGVSGAQSQKNELDAGEAFKDVSMPIEHGSNCDSPMKIQRDTGSLHGVGVSSNESGDPVFSGGGQEETTNLENAAGETSSKGFGAKKRKRSNQDMELDQVKGDHQTSGETSKENIEAILKAEQNNLTLATNKSNGKHAKDGADVPKDEYIHVRARRGQATNSHSLAERVRREKISERMKFLQDLVPGCNKVTGKAVMLDEIINYVQSLQRQVEFLSMKLAAVNPRLDFNIEGLLSKDILQSMTGSSSTIGFSPDMLHPQLHPSQQGLVQSGIPGIGNPSDALRRVINAQLTAMNTYKEPMSQLPNLWDDELHNVTHMGFDTNASLNTQELTGKTSGGFPI